MRRYEAIFASLSFFWEVMIGRKVLYFPKTDFGHSKYEKSNTSKYFIDVPHAKDQQ